MNGPAFTNYGGGDGPSAPGRRNHPYARPTLALSTSITVQNNIKKSDDQSKSDIDIGMKLIVGSVEQVIRWCQILSFIESTKIIYQVFGIMGSIKTGSNKCEKIFCLRSEHGKSGVVCVFYEIDRKIPNIPTGTLILCTGHVKGKNKLQIFTLRELCEDSKDSFDRISLVSQWAVNDILIYKKCKTI